MAHDFVQRLKNLVGYAIPCGPKASSRIGDVYLNFPRVART